VLELSTLSFEEFLDVMGKLELYYSVGLFGGSDYSIYDELQKLFSIYVNIGGYPLVVKRYLETKDIMPAIVITMLKEKKGCAELTTELSEIVSDCPDIDLAFFSQI
jgi:hypothetical protein